jgi:2-polyprenyl-6-methoxyphenol hydroxylase-like FAD-dependent oxidoreductase
VAAEGVPVRYGTTVTSLTDRDDGVEAVFTDGTRATFDLVVAADGLHSRTRELVMPDAPQPQRTGQLIWRASAPRPPQVDRYWMYDGAPALGKVGLVPIADDGLYLWLLRTDTGTGRPDDLLGALRAQLAPFGGHVPAVAEVLRPDVDLRSLQALLVPPPWHRGRVLFIGDAVHTTTPHIAYGVGIAIEDSVVLAELLAAGDVGAALGAFTARRWERCKLVVESSVQLGEWEQRPPDDPSLFGRLTGRALATLAQPW